MIHIGTRSGSHLTGFNWSDSIWLIRIQYIIYVWFYQYVTHQIGGAFLSSLQRMICLVTSRTIIEKAVLSYNFYLWTWHTQVTKVLCPKFSSGGNDPKRDREIKWKRFSPNIFSQSTSSRQRGASVGAHCLKRRHH